MNSIKNINDQENHKEPYITYNTNFSTNSNRDMNGWYHKGMNIGKKIEKKVKFWFKTFLNNDKDTQQKLKNLNNSAREFNIHLKLIAMKKVEEFVFSFQNSIFWTIKLSIQKLSEKLLGVYSFYKIVITIKNLIFSDYDDINNMLKFEVHSIIDRVLRYIFEKFHVNFNNNNSQNNNKILYAIIEQYFSLLIVGSIILVNMRSFLNLILFIYTMSFKNFKARVSELLQVLTLSYVVGLFYVCSSIFLIFSLPITYR